MTDRADTGTTDAAEPRPVSYYLTPGNGRTWLDARDRYDELTQRDLSARARAILVARGEYDSAKHGTSEPQPLTLTEHLEVLANGEVVARVYRHPVQVDHALQAGATWEQIADACGCSETQARQDYREWAEGQHRLWTGELGGGPGRFGLDDAGYAEALARLEPDPAEAHGFGRNQPGPYDREAYQ